MVQPNWNILMQSPDPGQAFVAGLETGRARREQEQGKAALNALFTNPNDPTALATYAQHDPRGAMAYRQQQQQAEQGGVEAHRDNILKGAQIVRQIQPKDEAGWQQVRAMAGQLGIPLDGVPETFDPAYAQGLVAVADTFNPAATAKPTAMQQNYEFLKSEDPDLATQYLKRQAAEPPMIASNGDGTFTIIPRSQMGQAETPGSQSGERPALSSPEEYQALPPGAEYTAPDGTIRRKGGAGPQTGPATFP